jgi:hypothetical protein
MHRTIITTCLLMAIAFSPLRSGAQEIAEKIDQAEQLKKAAVNREWAAVTQVDQAWQHTRESEALRYSATTDEVQRRKMLVAAAGSLAKAGGLEMRAVGNYGAAAKNWQSVASVWKGKAESAKQNQAQQQATANSNAVTGSCRRAAERYELAADLYRQLGTADAAKSASMSEKAAACRERLAKR